jgi:radical SAM protein with 4Fe4S-binding SPASM domain
MERLNNKAIKGNRVELQLFTTLKCNLKCSYCAIAVGSVINSQGDVAYSLDDLDNFINTHLKNYEKYITFFGGEPTLNINFISAVMEKYPLFRFQLQTNGVNLTRVPLKVTEKFSNVLVSLDGDREITNKYRGKGVYERIIAQIPEFRQRLKGFLTARVTWADENMSLNDFTQIRRYFDWIYFQFVQMDGVYSKSAIKQKKEVLKQLVEYFFKNDKFFPIIPVMGIIRNKLFPLKAIELYDGKTQCRASTHILNILPDGRVFPCPDMSYLPEMQQGNVVDNWLVPSPLQMTSNMPCYNCDAFSFCRGNCMKNLYLAYEKKDSNYKINIVEPVCELVKFLGDEIDRYDYRSWFINQDLITQNLIRNNEIYEFVEVMP